MLELGKEELGRMNEQMYTEESENPLPLFPLNRSDTCVSWKAE